MSGKEVRVLTIHNVMGEHQSFNNKAYSWNISSEFIEVTRNGRKWHAYFPCANIVKAEIEEVKT